jgi:predicted phosphodiesterase
MKILILADVHANLPALEAVLDAEGTWDEVLFLGDAVIGGPQPNEVLDLLRSLDGVFLMGNHDRQALNVDLDVHETDPHRIWSQWTRRIITPENWRFLEGLTGPQTVQRQGLTLQLIHGQLPKEASGNWQSRYIWPDAPDELMRTLIEQYAPPYILMGHCHVQYRRSVDGTEFINPGGLGQPRLGKVLACYAVLEDGHVDLRAVPYDCEKTARAMANMDLDGGFIAMWQEIYRRAELAPRYQSRDLTPLLSGPYS